MYYNSALISAMVPVAAVVTHDSEPWWVVAVSAGILTVAKLADFLMGKSTNRSLLKGLDDRLLKVERELIVNSRCVNMNTLELREAMQRQDTALAKMADHCTLAHERSKAS